MVAKKKLLLLEVEVTAAESQSEETLKRKSRW